MDRVLKILGVAWAVVTFIATAAFFFGGEWNDWKLVKQKVLTTSDEQQFSISSYSVESKNTQAGRSDLGKHKACFLAGVSNENRPNDTASCAISEDKGFWKLN